MKRKSNFHSLNNRSVLLTVLLTVTVVSSTYANWFYDRQEKTVAKQYAYGDTCVEVVHVIVKVCGITVQGEMEQRPFQCNMGNQNLIEN